MVMDGTKTQTRRLVDMGRLSVDIPALVRSDAMPGPHVPAVVAKPGRHRIRLNPHGAVVCLPMELGLKPGEFHFRCPLVDGTTHLADHGNEKKVWTITPVGEQRLWVKETWSRCDRNNIIYRADDIESLAKERQWVSWPTWRSPYHMSRGASRTNLIVLSVHLQPLQYITNDDAIAEGVRFTDYGIDKGTGQRPGWHYGPSKSHEECFHSPRLAFANMWNRLHGGPSWNHMLTPPWGQNPWVWAYTFRREATP
jgi:hypothetical protein